MTNVFYEINAFCRKHISVETFVSKTPPSLTFRTFEHKYIDFIKYVWASADGQIKGSTERFNLVVRLL